MTDRHWVSSRDKLPLVDEVVLKSQDGDLDVIWMDGPQGVWHNNGDRWSTFQEFGHFWWTRVRDTPEEQP